MKNLEAFRRSLPAECKMYVAKNTLIGIAADRVDGWSELKKGIKLENAWVFAPEEAISASVKAFIDFEKKLLEPIPKADRAKTKLTDISGALPSSPLSIAPGCLAVDMHACLTDVHACLKDVLSGRSGSRT